MINLEELTIEDLKDIEKLQEFRKEAETLYNIVVSKQKVPLILDELNRYRLFYDGNNAEYLQYFEKDGEWRWQARYLCGSYDVPINKDKIYKMIVAAYEHEKDESQRIYSNKNKNAIEQFKGYVIRLKRDE